MGQSKDNSIRILYAQLHEKKTSQTSASPTDNFSSSASPVEPASFRLLPVPISFIFFPWTLQRYWSFQLSKQCKNQVAGNFEQVQYFRPLNCTDSAYWGEGRRNNKKKKNKKSQIAELEMVKKVKNAQC